MIIGYTTGVYDLFHIGHLNLLKNAKGMCDKLIVGVTVDELVKYKGKEAFIPFTERAEIVRACKYVDSVDGFKLGNKICKLKQRGPLRTRYCGTPLNNEQFEKFDHLGVNWQIGGPLLKPKM